MSTPSNPTFQRLKPACVEVSRQAIRHLKSPIAARADLSKSLQELHKLLQQLELLGPTLADYVFFPLTYVFRDLENLPTIAVNLSVRCLRILVERGWPQPLEPDLFKQLLALLCRVALQEVTNGSEPDCLCAVFGCIASILEAYGGAVDVGQVAHRAVAGRIIDTALTALAITSAPRTQKAAVTSIRAILRHIQETRMLKNVLPGIFSRLTLLISTYASTQLPQDVLVSSLNILTDLLDRCIAEGAGQAPDEAAELNNSSQQPDDVTAQNVKLAMTKLARLRSHEKDEVIEALFNLCRTIIEKSQSDFEDPLDIAVEIAMGVCGREELPNTENRRARLIQSLKGSEQLMGRLTRLAHENIRKMPTLLMSANETSQSKVIRDVQSSYYFLSQLGCSQRDFEPLMAQGLLRSLSNDLPFSDHLASRLQADPQAFQNSSSHDDEAKPFDLFSSQATRCHLFLQVRKLLAFTSKLSRLSILQSAAGDWARSAPSNQKIALLWYISRTVEYALEQDLPDTRGSHDERSIETGLEISSVCFEHALEILVSEAAMDCREWRLDALALELVAFHARRLGKDFRPELADVLFPIIQRAASSNPILSEHALRCLRYVSSSCGYSTPAETLLHNADYLINAVSLRLDTLDLAPEIPRILTFLLRQSGSGLVPYLQDVVESLLSLLSTFHGYPLLVEQIFSVLGTIVDQAGQNRCQEHAQKPRHRTSRQIPSIETLPEALIKSGICQDEPVDVASRGPPNMESRAFKTDQTFQDKQSDPSLAEGKTALVQKMTKSIALLAQHFLGHESPQLRRKLLILLKDALEQLSCNEDDFLPLVNDIWDPLAQCLFDETHVVSLAAMDAVCTIFRHAGDFMSSRIEEEWPRIVRLCKGTLTEKERSEAPLKRNCGYSSPWRRRWNTHLRFLSSLAISVKVTAEIEDDLFSILGPLAREDPEVRESLQALNADATWLVLNAPEQQLERPSYTGRMFSVVT